MSFITCGKRLFNLAYVKSIMRQGQSVHIVVANTHQTAGYVATNRDMIWKCPINEFKLIDMTQIPLNLDPNDSNEPEILSKTVVPVPDHPKSWNSDPMY